ncbi:biogenesis of lysosome-related organelles complex 1 subunit 3 [Electrophorus electricus]|uniref:Biogenesis of lysosome-related organelles complex 1 subunit 3 n=1 Tax=Electrophorus electricus TaxID=8005 RepID=A0A4W4EC98_ELEEL|nr:biogenesis of lysosome-related organelles complex 1 subunit 3 [Electrophorus electricus]XP_026864329.1 biogenesis of lysosome-related organelles complex 1 subunit 3 [Electrophorus electricus]
MASSKFQIVVQGEASETDSDDEVYITSLPFVHASTSVPGEASETDSEGEMGQSCKEVCAGNSEESLIFRQELPPLVVIRSEAELVSGADDELKSEADRKYSTLLQQKLEESNARLCADINQCFRYVYQNATREILMATTHLNNSQSGIINASHSVRLILEDLRSVTEKIEIITNCNLLPDITTRIPFSGL